MKKEQIESYAKVTRQALTNPNLSSDALRLLILMTNNSEEWKVQTTYYQKLLAWHPSRLSKNTVELIKLGYLVKNKTIIPGTNKFEYSYSFPTTFTITNVVNTMVVDTNFVKPKLNKNNLNNAPTIKIPGLSGNDIKKALVLNIAMDSINQYNKKEIEGNKNQQAVQLPEEHHSKEGKIEKLNTAGYLVEKQVEKVGEPISNPKTDLKAITDIQEENNTEIHSTKEVDSDAPIFDNWVPKTQLADPSSIQIDLSGLNGKEELTDEDKLQVFASVKQKFILRATEFSSQEVMSERLRAYATKLKDNNFKSGGKSISRWNQFLDGAIGGIISDLNFKQIEKEEAKEASQIRTLKILGLMDADGKFKTTGTKYGETSSNVPAQFVSTVSKEEQEINNFFSSDKFKKKQPDPNFNPEDLF